MLVRMRRLAALALLALSALLATACAPVTAKLRGSISAGRYDEAIAEGRRYLDAEARKAGGSRGPAAADVAHLVAEAELERARRDDDVAALRAVRAAYDGRPGFPDVVARAVALGAEVELRKIVLPNPTVAAARELRERYPGTPQAQRARELEVEAADATAAQAGSVAAERRFRADYGGWREAEAAVARSRVREVALAAAAARGDADALLSFVDAYRAWPEADRARAAALEDAAAHALAEAGTDLERLAAFRARFPGPPWAARADAAIATALLAPVLRALEAGGAPAAADVERVLSATIDPGALRSAASPLEPRFRELAERSSDPAPSLLYAALFPDSPRAAEATARARALAWDAARREGTAGALRAFVERFPGSDEADAAERRAATLERLAARDPSAPRAVITSSRALPGGEVEMTLDVLRCGKRVAGLRRGAFELYVGGQPRPLTGFLSLEEDRPLQIVFALDLSGSMSTEREAVRRAIREFAETFRFRGRDAAFGLVTFSDELRDRRAPTRRPDEFRRWLEGLGDAKGGAFENTTGALTAASDLLGRSPAERVVVLLTDEPMQSGSSGVIAAARRTRACTPVFRLVETYAACGTASCRLAAARQVGGPIAMVIDACVSRFGAAFCDRQLDPGVFGPSFAACVGGDAQYVRAGSRELRDVGASLSSRAVRPFMILPHELSEGGPFVDLARSLDGQVHPVDDDSTDSATFMRPLLAIADQLSKQYVLRYRPEGGDGAARPQVVVRLDHEWNGWGESARAATLVPLARSSASCPELAALSPGGALHRSRECGRRFERWAPGGVGAVDAIAPGPRGALLVLAGGRVQAVEPEGAPAPLEVRVARPAALQAGWDGTAWVGGRDASGAVAFARWGERGFAPFRLDGLASAPLALLPGGATGSACALVSPERRLCGDGAGPSRASDVVGVDPRRVASGPGEVLALPGIAGAFLWATADGAVLRTTDSGGHFREVLAAGDSPWRLAVVPAARALVCAASARAVRCSEDLGLSWFAAGADLETPSASVALGAAGGQVFLDRGDRLRRLTRVVNRDIPSSAVYFETASDAPRAAIQPFLASLGRTLAASSELVLRVEGHADRRGDDAYNDDLARKRAERIADAVVAAGGRRSQVEVASYGSRRPIRPGSDAESLARNRRVELVLLEPMSIAAVPAEPAAAACPADADEAGGDGAADPATAEDPAETPPAPDDEPDAAPAPEEDDAGEI